MHPTFRLVAVFSLLVACKAGGGDGDGNTMDDTTVGTTQDATVGTTQDATTGTTDGTATTGATGTADADTGTETGGGECVDGQYGACEIVGMSAEVSECMFAPGQGACLALPDGQSTCSLTCETTADCPCPAEDATADVGCTDLTAMDGNDTKYCYLSCAGGLTCPSDMTCYMNTICLHAPPPDMGTDTGSGTGTETGTGAETDTGTGTGTGTETATGTETGTGTDTESGTTN